jgi:hypothetical protein
MKNQQDNIIMACILTILKRGSLHMALRCPHCRATAKTRTSVELSLLVKKSYHQCQNMLCGYCFTSMTEIDSSLNQTQPIAGATVPQDALPESHQGRESISFAV